jgi:5-methylcytosine-specific restriction enzyme subunit McrC
MRSEQKTIVVQEYGRPTPMRMAAAGLGVTVFEFESLLARTLEHISPQVGTGAFIEYQRDSFRFVKVAGILALNHFLRIEVVPKFLRIDSAKWREDFLWIAAQTHFGSLFRNFLLPLSTRKDANLFEIIAHTWLDHFERNQRGFIRNYVHTEWEDFSIDGDVDEEDLFYPTPNGFGQSGLRLSASNTYNRLLAEAARHLRSQVSSPDSLLRLDRAFTRLARAIGTAPPRHTSHRILSRHQRWLPLLELSRLVLDSKTFGYSRSGQASLPSYILRTHEAWEVLVRLACRRAHPGNSVQKVRFPLGFRQSGRGTARLNVTPDVTIGIAERQDVLVDAKYKTALGSESDAPRSAVVSNADIYESLAFMRAAKGDVIHLVYPEARDVFQDPRLGQPLEVVSVGQQRIFALSVGVTGISESKGFQRFAMNVRDVLSDLYEGGDKLVQRKITDVEKEDCFL